MISSKKLIRMVRKWQKLAAARSKGISWPISKVAEKGHFIIYTLDGKRFMIPLSYLKSKIVTQLFQMAEEEFGLTIDGPITLPCDSTFMKYAITVLQIHATKDFEKAFIPSLGTCHFNSALCLHQKQINQKLLIQSF